jgi:hypothetical protein
MLGNGEVWGKLQTAWDELLDHGDALSCNLFPPLSCKSTNHAVDISINLVQRFNPPNPYQVLKDRNDLACQHARRQIAYILSHCKIQVIA